MLTPLERLSYLARQGTRVAWYMGHYFASARFRNVPAPKSDAIQKRTRPAPSREAILTAMAKLFARDLANVEAGYYPLPDDGDGPLIRLLKTSRAYFNDLPSAARRKEKNDGREIARQIRDKDGLPGYFLQNFHFQTGGYLTGSSARLYDIQTEVLFSGATNAMRRQCLVAMAKYIHGRDQRKLAVADVACGTGRLLRFIKQAWPRIRATGVDLSQSYLDEAARHIKPFNDVALICANAEKLPFADNSLDIVTTVYLFHEVPAKVRRIIAGELYRVLRPGGLLVFMDSLQPGDVPEFDRLLEVFPVNFHEPYYAGYLREDLAGLFTAAGFGQAQTDTAFMSRLMVCSKPPSPAQNRAKQAPDQGAAKLTAHT